MSKKNATGRQRDANGDADQFDRFEQLTRRLLAVPKQEADKERAKKGRKGSKQR
jgi:hypothetical protein